MTVSRIKNATLWVCFALFFPGCSALSRPDLDPESQAFYETARLIMTKAEIRIFTHLPDADSRAEFIQDFWDKRDPDRFTEMNEFQDEFYRRVDYADHRFIEGIPGWKTDRGRMYIYFGPPDTIDRYPVLDQPDVKGMEIWYYYRLSFALRFLDEDGTGSYTLDPYYGIAGNFFDAVEAVKLGMLPGLDEGFQDRYADFKAEFLPEDEALQIRLPVEALIFTEGEDVLRAEIVLDFFVYTRKGEKIMRFQRGAHFEKTEAEIIDMEEIVLNFPMDIERGDYYFDITLEGAGLAKTRKIFEIAVRTK
jgi:GWxTD domain-containing protein